MRFAAILALAFASCSTSVYYPNGKLAMRTYSNSSGLAFQSGSVSLKANTINNSTPTRAASKFADIIGSTAASIAVPGSGVTPLVGRAAINATPTVTTLFAKPGD